MRYATVAALTAGILFAVAGGTTFAGDHDDNDRRGRADQSIQLGPRPFYLLQVMDPGPLKSRLFAGRRP